jgi:septal ring factor EnvC (AmiA/AmiB activator)
LRVAKAKSEFAAALVAKEEEIDEVKQQISKMQTALADQKSKQHGLNEEIDKQFQVMEEKDHQVELLKAKIADQSRQLDVLASFSTQLKQQVETYKYEIVAEREKVAVVQGQDLAK